MKTRLFVPAFIGLLTLVFVSCVKEVTELPAPSQSGADIFGCRVNGTFWVPAGFGIMPTAHILESRMLGNDLYINARNFSRSPTESEFEIAVKGITGVGTYPLQSGPGYPNAGSYGYYVERRIRPTNEWITSSPYVGVVHITHFDSVNLVVSGTFEFEGLNLDNDPQPLSVTEGRFDLKIR